LQECERFLESYGNFYKKFQLYTYLLIYENWVNIISCLKRCSGWIIIIISIIYVIFAIYFTPDKWNDTLVPGFGIIASLVLTTFKNEVTSPTLRAKVDSLLTQKGIETTERVYITVLTENKSNYSEYPSFYYRLKVDNLNPNKSAINAVPILVSVKKLRECGNCWSTKGDELQLKVKWRKEDNDFVNITYSHSFSLCAFIPNWDGKYAFSIKGFGKETPTRLAELYKNVKVRDIFLLQYIVTAENCKSNRLYVAIYINEINPEKIKNNKKKLIIAKQILPSEKYSKTGREIRDLFNKMPDDAFYS